MADEIVVEDEDARYFFGIPAFDEEKSLSDCSYDLASESEDESTLFEVTPNVNRYSIRGTGENARRSDNKSEILMQARNFGAGDFLPYESKKSVPVNHESSSSPQQKQPEQPTSVKRFGDIIASIREKQKLPKAKKPPPKREITVEVEKQAPKKVKKNKKKKINIAKKAASSKPTHTVKDDLKKKTQKKKEKRSKKHTKATELDLYAIDRDDKGRYKCPKCTKTFSEMRRLKIHFRIHMERTYKVCEDCGAQYITRHNACPASGLTYKCPTCFQTFSRKTYLTQHQKIHEPDKKFKCTLCDKAFNVKSSLSTHLATHSQKRVPCNFCEKVFLSLQLLRVHCRTHTLEKPYECSFCKKSFSQRANLNAHVRTHTKEHPYICDKCGKSFAHKSTQVAHIRTHTNEKPYVCDVCNKSFSSRGSLYNHMACHNERKYSCRYCDAKFAHSQSFRYHENNHVKQGDIIETES